MNRTEKLLYHQIHPAKLATDWVCGLLSLIPFWNHEPMFGVLLAFVPSFAASYLMVRYVDVSAYKRTRFGTYMAKHMSGTMQFVRMFGFILMILGAWYHDALVIVLGLALILLAWLNGYFSESIRASVRTVHAPRTRVPKNLPR